MASQHIHTILKAKPKRNSSFFGGLLILLLIGSSMTPSVTAAAGPSTALDTQGLTGGLIVLLGCRDAAKLTSDTLSKSFVVHVLEADADRVTELRRQLIEAGRYGRVSVMHLSSNDLPYADNLVNLVVAEQPSNIPDSEITRVLAPGGIFRFHQQGKWTTRKKPWPPEIDQWTHYMYDASGNPVAHDQVVGPPGTLQWIAGPRHSRSHEYIPSTSSLVSASGRIFYIADQTPVADIARPSHWVLVARDAFNGIQLWTRPLASWFPHLINWGQAPRQLQRKLVAVGERVYVALGLHAPLTQIDAATGKVVRTYANTRGTEEIVFHQGVLLLVVREVTPDRVAELRKWSDWIAQRNEKLTTRDSAAPLVARLKNIENRAPKRILAVDATTGTMLWKIDGPASQRFRSVSLCASGNRIYYQNGGKVVCVSLRDGQELWSEQAPVLRVVHGDRVYCAGGKEVVVLAGDTGSVVWRSKLKVTEVRDLFVAAGSVWVGGFKPIEGKRGPSWGPYFVTQRDLATGKVLMHIEPDNPGHHHRCYLNKATDRYILGGRRGTEFIDLESGDVLWNSWVRGVCKYGVMPCNGLLYAPPHACACYLTAKTAGFYALGPRKLNLSQASSPPWQLDKGPAFGTVDATEPARQDDWPTFRHDARRSGSSPTAIPTKLHIRWRADVGGRASSPTVANGQVFACVIDQHRVVSLACTSGKQRWSFTAGARIDSPPTIANGRAVFGSRDGSLYSLRAADGLLDWRLQPRSHHLVSVEGQLESTAPLHGSVLLTNGALFATAGRSSYIDGGIDLLKVEPESGKILHTSKVFSPDPTTGKQPEQYDPNTMPGALTDILTSDAQHVYLRDLVFGFDTRPQDAGNAHLLTLTGFRDDTWAHRSFWIFGTRVSISSGCSGRARNIIAGRLLTFNDTHVFGYGRTRVHWSNQFEDGPYRLFAMPQNGRVADWSKPLPITARSLVLAGKTLYVAGVANGVERGSTANQEVLDGLILAVSATDGTVLSRCRVPGVPAFDALAVANDCLFLTLENGQLVCLGDAHASNRGESRP